MLNWIEKQAEAGKWEGNLQAQACRDLLRDLHKAGADRPEWISPTMGEAGHLAYYLEQTGKEYTVKIYWHTGRPGGARVVFYVDEKEDPRERIWELIAEAGTLRAKADADRELLKTAGDMAPVIEMRIEDTEREVTKKLAQAEELRKAL
jgi:hypothetical protein